MYFRIQSELISIYCCPKSDGREPTDSTNLASIQLITRAFSYSATELSMFLIFFFQFHSSQDLTASHIKYVDFESNGLFSCYGLCVCNS